ncbi:hypothetical protein TSTA_124290 [Talaromyces stipitatus ATCC 10500]|uniref:Uncharacterized protein n=1 Tax=Talaromyces stipitatus (strain ATCC 10500 / CBS 375.48 / QM 6759 / NRRL 1006) TaxID=441959 RepID=B8MB01_TALSN|nr:uncharacterized protein TSTA_124290 [Talaromyces stipitatus ATCC 10500]EED18702.1 hypothetical protein TSTA_124290 [Talaromyces stipitatus ATCC 10500]
MSFDPTNPNPTMGDTFKPSPSTAVPLHGIAISRSRDTPVKKKNSPKRDMDDDVIMASSESSESDTLGNASNNNDTGTTRKADEVMYEDLDNGTIFSVFPLDSSEDGDDNDNDDEDSPEKGHNNNEYSSIDKSKVLKNGDNLTDWYNNIKIRTQSLRLVKRHIFYSKALEFERENTYISLGQLDSRDEDFLRIVPVFEINMIPDAANPTNVTKMRQRLRAYGSRWKGHWKVWCGPKLELSQNSMC